MKLTTIQCPKCRETWLPRVEQPKRCPYCQKPMSKRTVKVTA